MIPPLYEPLPHRYRGVDWCAAVCEVPGAAVSPFLPEPLEADVGTVARIELFFARYAHTTYGPYQEAGLLVPARFGQLAGQCFVALYLDNVAAIACGREVIGSPKKDAEVSFSRDGDRIMAGCVRRGVELLHLEARLDDRVQVQRLPLGPRLLVREIPRADGPGLELRQVLRKDFNPAFFTIHERRTGGATLRVGGTDEDPLHRLEPLRVLGVAYSFSDFSLEHCAVLHTEFVPREAAVALAEPAAIP